MDVQGEQPVSGVKQENDLSEHVSNTTGNVTIIRLGEDVRDVVRRFSWLIPVALGIAVFVGLNLACTLLLWDAFRAANTNYLLVYNHQIKEEAYLAAHGVPVDSFGEPLPPPR